MTSHTMHNIGQWWGICGPWWARYTTWQAWYCMEVLHRSAEQYWQPWQCMWWHRLHHGSWMQSWLPSWLPSWKPSWKPFFLCISVITSAMIVCIPCLLKHCNQLKQSMYVCSRVWSKYWWYITCNNQATHGHHKTGLFWDNLFVECSKCSNDKILQEWIKNIDQLNRNKIWERYMGKSK